MIVSILIVSTPFVFGEEKSQPVERKEKDSAGREWTLKDWNENEGRPYPKNLKEREEWYRKKWGENWSGPKSTCRILTPGKWEWEVVFTVPPHMAKKIEAKRKSSHSPNRQRIWGDRFWGQAFAWAPGGGEVTDIYALADNGVLHYDSQLRTTDFIGNPEQGGMEDGVNERARFSPGSRVTLDPVSGRLYFIQSNVWRYMEKLLPYESDKSSIVYYLPAVLDWNELYRQVKAPDGGQLKPAKGGDGRRDPVFAVRSNPAVKKLELPGPYLTGRRPLITPEGKSGYFAEAGMAETQTLYDVTSLFDIETGRKLGKLKLEGHASNNFKSGTDGPGSHGGNCVGYEGIIYNAQHGGCCGPCTGSPGRMFSIDPQTGKVTMLYDSMPEDGSWAKQKAEQPYIDGPADAGSLLFTSTLFQAQCPRTGAILNGGWDFSGIRRYHDGFVTSIVDNNENRGIVGRPGWKGSPILYHGDSNPAIAPNGDLYIADDNSKEPRIVRIYRIDWPKEQPVNGYAEKFLPREKLEALMIEYAQRYIANFTANNRLLERSSNG